jgi:hypothetical protein
MILVRFEAAIVTVGLIPRFQIDRLAEAVGVLVHSVETERNLAVERLVQVRREPLVAIGAAEQSDFAERREAGFLGDAVDHASAAAPPENHSVGALQRLDTLEVVEVAIILYVVANSVEEEIGGRAIAADDQLVAVVLALDCGDAGHVADHVADAHHHLIFDQLLGNDSDGLRHVAQRCERLGRAADGSGLVVRGFGDGDGLVDAGNLQDELANLSPLFGNDHGLPGVGKAFRGDPHRVEAAIEKHGKFPVWVSCDGGRGRSSVSGQCGDLSAPNGSARTIEDLASQRSPISSCPGGRGRLEGRAQPRCCQQQAKDSLCCYGNPIADHVSLRLPYRSQVPPVAIELQLDP